MTKLDLITLPELGYGFQLQKQEGSSIPFYIFPSQKLQIAQGEKDQIISEKQPKYFLSTSSSYAHHENRVTASKEKKIFHPIYICITSLKGMIRLNYFVILLSLGKKQGRWMWLP